MATLQEIRDLVDARLATLWTALVNRQATYFASKGRYWQGLISHASIPTDGIDTPATRLTTKPTDQQEDWLAFGVTAANLLQPFALTVDAYSGPLGHGFVGTVRARLTNGQVYTRSKGHGPEDRDVPWIRES